MITVMFEEEAMAFPAKALRGGRIDVSPLDFEDSAGADVAKFGADVAKFGADVARFGAYEEEDNDAK